MQICNSTNVVIIAKCTTQVNKLNKLVPQGKCALKLRIMWSWRLRSGLVNTNHRRLFMGIWNCFINLKANRLKCNCANGIWGNAQFVRTQSIVFLLEFYNCKVKSWQHLWFCLTDLYGYEIWPPKLMEERI